MDGRANLTSVTILATLWLVSSVLGGCAGAAPVVTPPAATSAPVATSAPLTSPVQSAASNAASASTPSPVPSPSAATKPWPLPAAAELPKATGARLQATLERLLARTAAKGAAAAIVTPEGSWVGVTGVDGVGKKIVPTSAFGIGSTSKTVTAAEILLLASNGKINLDGQVADLLKLPFDGGGATIRQLATMQSGFPAGSDGNVELAVAKDLHRTWSIADLLDFMKDAPRLGTMGGPGKYNGVNYQVLSQVIERVTGQPLATVFRRDVLRPAGLDRMWTQVGEQPTGPLAIAVDPGTGIVDAKSGYLPSLSAASTGNGAAGMAADAPTLARWGYLLYGGRVIDPSLVATMTKPNWSSEFGYGFGTMVDHGTGEPVVGHGGDYMGYSSMLLAWPSTHTAVAVLVPREGMSNDGTVPGWAFELYKALTVG